MGNSGYHLPQHQIVYCTSSNLVYLGHAWIHEYISNETETMHYNLMLINLSAAAVSSRVRLCPRTVNIIQKYRTVHVCPDYLDSGRVRQTNVSMFHTNNSSWSTFHTLEL